MAILFNQEHDLTYIYTSLPSGLFSSNNADGTVYDLFADNTVVGNYIVFGIRPNTEKSPYGKFQDLKFYVGTALVADAITLVWEYLDGTTSATAWTALSNVIDNTNSFQNTGENWVTFDVPDDWGTTTVNNKTDAFWVRCRISALTNLTEGGAQSTQKIRCKDYTIEIPSGEFSEATKGIFADIQAANDNSNWGVVSNSAGICYEIECNLKIDSYFETKQEVVLFKPQCNMSVDYFYAGELITGKITNYGSLFLFQITKRWRATTAAAGVTLGSNSYFYDSTIRFIRVSGVSSRIGVRAALENINCTFEELGDFWETSNNAVYLKNEIKLGTNSGAVDFLGWFIDNWVHSISGNRAIIFQYSGDNYLYNTELNNNVSDIGTLQFTGNSYIINPINFVAPTGDIWQGAGNTGKITVQYTLLLQILDKNNNPVSGAVITVNDIDDVQQLSQVTSNDGYANQDYGVATAGTDNTLTDSSKSWDTDEHKYEKIYITSNTGAGQERVIKANTGSQITIVGTWDINPDATSKYIIVPRFTYAEYTTPDDVNTTETLKTPHSITVQKTGYQIYTKQFTLDEKIDWRVAMLAHEAVFDGLTG